MLYQLSYASTGKPSENIIEAIELQASFQAYRKTIATRSLIGLLDVWACPIIQHMTSIRLIRFLRRPRYFGAGRRGARPKVPGEALPPVWRKGCPANRRYAEYR